MNDSPQEDPVASFLIYTEDSYGSARLLSNLSNLVIITGILKTHSSCKPNAGVLTQIDTLYSFRM